MNLQKIVLLLTLLILGGCAGKEMEVTSGNADSIAIARLTHDSLFMKRRGYSTDKLTVTGVESNGQFFTVTVTDSSVRVVIFVTVHPNHRTELSFGSF